MMSFGAKPDTAGVLVPDHTHWGNEGPLLGRISDGKGIPGWDSQYSHIKVRAGFEGRTQNWVLSEHEFPE